MYFMYHQKIKPKESDTENLRISISVKSLLSDLYKSSSMNTVDLNELCWSQALGNQQTLLPPNCLLLMMI